MIKCINSTNEACIQLSNTLQHLFLLSLHLYGQIKQNKSHNWTPDYAIIIVCVIFTFKLLNLLNLLSFMFKIYCNYKY